MDPQPHPEHSWVGGPTQPPKIYILNPTLRSEKPEPQNSCGLSGLPELWQLVMTESSEKWVRMSGKGHLLQLTNSVISRSPQLLLKSEAKPCTKCHQICFRHCKRHFYFFVLYVCHVQIDLGWVAVLGELHAEPRIEPWSSVQDKCFTRSSI